MVGSQVGGQIKTRVDELIALISERGQLSAPDAAKALSVDQDMVESWARFLEKSGDIKIVYKGLTPTFVAIDVPSAEEPEAPKTNDKARVSHWQSISSAIRAQIDRVKGAIEQKTYESIKPTMTAMRSYLAKISEQLDSISVEEKDRVALEKSIERVTKRIDGIENHSDGARPARLRSESKRLEKDIETLAKKLVSLPEPQLPVAPTPTSEPDVGVPIAPSIAPSNTPQPVHASPDAGLSKLEELEAHVREALEAGDVDKAEELHARIEEHYQQTLPKRYEAVRSELKERIYRLKQELAFAGERGEHKSFATNTDRIRSLLESYSDAVEQSRWSDAERLENEIVVTYNALPRGYEEEKKNFEERFGTQIIEAAKKRRSELNTRIEKIRAALDQGKQALSQSIENGDFTTAHEAYGTLKSLLDHVPPQLVIERIEMQAELLEEFERLTNAFKERFIARNEAQIERCTHLIEHIKHALSNGSIAQAQQSYEKASHALARIDHNYFEQRSRLQYDLMRAHKSVLDASAQNAERAFEDVVKRFQDALKDGRSYLVNNEPDLAESVYLKLLELYRELPSGHEARKQALKDQIGDYYRDLHVARTTPTPHANINDILDRLVTIHHAINSGDPSVLVGELKRVEQLVEALPASVRAQNPTLDKELVRLTHLRRIYEGVLDANRALDRNEPYDVAGFIEESERWIETEAVNAASVIFMLGALKSRIRISSDTTAAEPSRIRTELHYPSHLEAPSRSEGEPRDKTPGQAQRPHNLDSRIEAIRSLLKD